MQHGVAIKLKWSGSCTGSGPCTGAWQARSRCIPGSLRKVSGWRACSDPPSASLCCRLRHRLWLASWGTVHRLSPIGAGHRLLVLTAVVPTNRQR